MAADTPTKLTRLDQNGRGLTKPGQIDQDLTIFGRPDQAEGLTAMVTANLAGLAQTFRSDTDLDLKINKTLKVLKTL